MAILVLKYAHAPRASRDSFKSGARYLLRDPISPPVTLSNNRRLSAAAVTCLDLRRLLVDAGDDLVGDAKLHFP